MITVEELNNLRQRGQWDELGARSRELLEERPTAEAALRGVVQSIEKTGDKGDEYENALLRLLEQKSRTQETAQKLAEFYKEQGNTVESLKHYEISLRAAVEDRHYNAIDSLWTELIESEPENTAFFLSITDLLHEQKHSQKAAGLLESLIEACAEREDWTAQLTAYRRLLEYTPERDSLRQDIVNAYKEIFGEAVLFDRIVKHVRILESRPIEEAINDLEEYLFFLPGQFVMHPDWGVGRVKELDIVTRRCRINFQRKKGHRMGLDLAHKALDRLEAENFRVLAVIDKERLAKLKEEKPIELIKIVLKSFGGSLTGKQLKEHMVPAVMADRHWSSWWTNTSSALRKDPYIAVSSGANKTYSLREEAMSEEDDIIKRFDAAKIPLVKVERVYEYLRTTRRSDLNEAVLKHFSAKLKSLIKRRKGAGERVEMWYANEDLKAFIEGVESADESVLDDIALDVDKAKLTLRRLRYKTHEERFAERVRRHHPEAWAVIFEEWLLSPNVFIRDELAKTLMNEDESERLNAIIEKIAANYRDYPSPFIWLAERQLTGAADWLGGRISNASIIERLLLLVDFLTSQAKRRERDEGLELRKVAGDAREIIRRNHYLLFKKHIAEADESLAQAIYRRAQANEGLDARSSADLVTIIRARFPTLMKADTLTEESPMPDGLLCLPDSLDAKRALLKRLVEFEMPQVVVEIDTARQQGDLRENAEYHAARDKHKLLSSQTAELQDQLQIAKAVHPEEITYDAVGFGVRFTVSPTGADESETYTMLGPWESDPDRNVLSYQAPFARTFMGAKAGDIIEVELPMHTGQYEVIAIDPIPREQIQAISLRVAKAEPASTASYEDEDSDDETGEETTVAAPYEGEAS